MDVNETWNAQAANIFISRSSIGSQGTIIDEYTGMNGSIEVKQADVVLDTFPLNYRNNYTAADSLSDLEYYAGKQVSLLISNHGSIAKRPSRSTAPA